MSTNKFHFGSLCSWIYVDSSKIEVKYYYFDGNKGTDGKFLLLGIEVKQT